MAWFKALAPRVGEFDKLGCALYAISADTPAMLEKFSQSCGVDKIPFLSDPNIQTASLFNLAVSTRHPMALKYPKGFLQPGFFLYDQRGETQWQWRQLPKLRNFFGAKNRPSVEEILAQLNRLRSGNSHHNAPSPD